MARRKKKQAEPQYTTQAVGEEALDRGVRGIDIKPIEPASREQAGRNDEHGHRTGRGGGSSSSEEGEDSGR